MSPTVTQGAADMDPDQFLLGACSPQIPSWGFAPPQPPLPRRWAGKRATNFLYQLRINIHGFYQGVTSDISPGFASG